MIDFEQAMYEVLETSRYDFLTGRRIDIREHVGELFYRFLVWFARAFDIILPIGEAGNIRMIASVFSIVAIVLIIIAFVVLIRTYSRRRKPVEHTLEDIFEEIKNHTVAELLQLSKSATDNRIAVRYKYIAVILWLDENDIISIEPSDTNAIILRQIKTSAPHMVSPFTQIANAFHLTWFGHKNLNDESITDFNLAVETVVGHA